MDSPYRRELQVAIEAQQYAARISQAVISTQDKGVLEKDDLSPVTVADYAIQALLTATIHHSFPDDKFVGEESSAQLKENPILLDRVWSLLQRFAPTSPDTALCKTPASKEQTCEMIDWCGNGVPTPAGGDANVRTWVFDPIDGTKTFVRGEMYAVNMCLLQGGKQIVGVVGCPVLSMDAQAPVSNGSVDPTGTGCILFAVRGHGAYVRPLPGSWEAVEPRKLPRRTEADLRSVTCFRLLDSGVDDVHEAVAATLGIESPGCDLLGWVPRWATLALGLANFTVWVYKRRDRYAKIWDHAGAMLLFEEVGGKVTDVDGKPIDLVSLFSCRLFSRSKTLSLSMHLSNYFLQGRMATGVLGKLCLLFFIAWSWAATFNSVPLYFTFDTIHVFCAHNATADPFGYRPRDEN